MKDGTRSPSKSRRLWLIAAALTIILVAVVGYTVANTAGGPATPRRVALAGFGEVAYRVERGTKTVKTGCALLAATQQQQERGLMNVRDLKGYDGMIFQFASDTDVGFYMKDTPMPLSIAWFDRTGALVSSADMAPNNATKDYYAAAPYRYAFEVPQGKLGPAGIGADSTLVFGGTC